MEVTKATYNLAVDALCHCRLEHAALLFAESAKHYMQAAKSERKNGELNRLNAAICFYLAGRYEDTVKIIDSLRTTKFEPRFVALTKELYEEAKKRRQGSYWETIKGDFKNMQLNGLHRAIIDLLKQDPYCLSPKAFARQLADSCYALNLPEIAKSFEKDWSQL